MLLLQKILEELAAQKAVHAARAVAEQEREKLAREQDEWYRRVVEKRRETAIESLKACCMLHCAPLKWSCFCHSQIGIVPYHPVCFLHSVAAADVLGPTSARYGFLCSTRTKRMIDFLTCLVKKCAAASSVSRSSNGYAINSHRFVFLSELSMLVCAPITDLCRAIAAGKGGN